MLPREKLIRVLQERAPITEAALAAAVGRTEVYDPILSDLLSQGYIHRLGTGRRGNPYKIVLSKAWPYNKCPMCGHVENQPDPLQFEQPSAPVPKPNSLTVEKVEELLTACKEKGVESVSIRELYRLIHADRNHRAWEALLIQLSASPAFVWSGTGRKGNPKTISLASAGGLDAEANLGI